MTDRPVTCRALACAETLTADQGRLCDIHEPRCGFDCQCCGYGDGTFPADHARNCDLITNRDGDWSDCTCDAKPRPSEEP